MRGRGPRPLLSPASPPQCSTVCTHPRSIFCCHTSALAALAALKHPAPYDARTAMHQHCTYYRLQSRYMYSSTWPSPGRTWPAVPRRTVSTPAVCTWRACLRVDTPRYVCALMARAGVSFFAHLVGSSPHAHMARLTTRTYSSTRPHQQMWRIRNPEVLLAPERTLPCSTFALPHDWSC